MSKAEMTIQPNVEDLLASIRKAIDGQGPKSSERRYAEPRPASPPAEPAPRDFARLFGAERKPARYEPLAHSEAPSAILSLRRTQTDMNEDWHAAPPDTAPVSREPAPAAASEPRHEEPPYLPAPVSAHREETPLLSSRSSEAANAAFSHLADSLMARATGERSVEDLTRELLRTMLKQWLDDNLPEMVERLVREEIERVARRGARR